MVKEEITLPDGRYLIAYSFPDDEDDNDDSTNGDGPSAEKS